MIGVPITTLSLFFSFSSRSFSIAAVPLALPCLAVGRAQSTFCPFEEHYFDTPQALARHYKEDFGFTPTAARVEDIDRSVLQALTGQVRLPVQQQ